VAPVEHLERTNTEKFAIESVAEEQDIRVEQTIEVERMNILGRAVFIGEGQVAFEQRTDVGVARVIRRDLALEHSETVSAFGAAPLVTFLNTGRES
jgi:hypothetical protein